jgi:hypothetical protein
MDVAVDDVELVTVVGVHLHSSSEVGRLERATCGSAPGLA